MTEASPRSKQLAHPRRNRKGRRLTFSASRASPTGHGVSQRTCWPRNLGRPLGTWCPSGRAEPLEVLPATMGAGPWPRLRCGSELGCVPAEGPPAGCGVYFSRCRLQISFVRFPRGFGNHLISFECLSLRVKLIIFYLLLSI